MWVMMLASWTSSQPAWMTDKDGEIILVENEASFEVFST